MRYKRNDVIVWTHTNELSIDIPYGATFHTMSDGTLRATIKTPKGEPAINSVVNCVGVPLAKKA